MSEKFFSRNLLGNASSVAATEVALFFARRTVFIQLVRSISAIIFAIAEKPFRNATVIGMSRTPSPATEKKKRLMMISKVFKLPKRCHN